MQTDRLQDPQGGSLQLRRIPIRSLNPEDQQRWRDLADAGIEVSPFSEPQFLVPLAAHLLPDSPPLCLLVLEDFQTNQWITACIAFDLQSRIERPLPRLRSLDSCYSYLNQFLVRNDGAAHHVDALFRIMAWQRRWHGIRQINTHLDSPLNKLVNSAAERHGVACFPGRVSFRAELCLRKLRGHNLLGPLSKTRRKSLRRSWKWLERQGVIDFRLLRPDPGDTECVERFLALENSGWKHEQGSSLLSQADQTRFFREMIQNFAQQHRAWFGELTLNGRVIASTCNLLSQRTLFAYKIGWDPDYRAGSPGLWSELLLADTLIKQHPHVDVIDSCSQEASYLESVWKDRKRVGTVDYVWSLRAKALCTAREPYRFVKKHLSNTY